MTDVEAIYRASSPEYIDAAEVAKLVRRALRRAFGETYPQVRFGVRTHKYAGGSSIHVRWIDGPTTAEVDAVVGPYAGGGFDGMIDLAYSASAWLLPDGSATFAHTGGTEGSRGTVPAADASRPHPDARLVRFMSDHVFAERDYSDAARARIEAYADRHRPVNLTPTEVQTGPWSWYGYAQRASFTADGMMHVRRDRY